MSSQDPYELIVALRADLAEANATVKYQQSAIKVAVAGENVAIESIVKWLRSHSSTRNPEPYAEYYANEIEAGAHRKELENKWLRKK